MTPSSDSLFTASIRRGDDGHTTVEWRSEFLESVWQVMAGGSVTNNYWNVGSLYRESKLICKRGGATSIYAIDWERLQRTIECTVDLNHLQVGPKPNLGPLLLVGMGKGLKTTIEHPIPTSALKLWADKTRILVEKILETLNPVDITIRLTPKAPGAPNPTILPSVGDGSDGSTP